MKGATVRFNLIRGRGKRPEDEPTARQRGIRVYDELKRRGWDAGAWDGQTRADVIVAQYGARAVTTAAPLCEYVIWDCNDALFLPHHGEAKHFGAALDAAVWVVTGSERLAQHIRMQTGGSPCVSYMPEAIDPIYDAVVRKPSKGLSIVWMGMDDNLMYVAVADDALSALAVDHDFEVVFVSSAQNSQGVSNAALVAQKHYRGRHAIWTPETTVAELGAADISICPIFQCEWCWCKSCNKAATFAGVGLPVVVSDVPSYCEFIEHGVNGFVAFSPEDWYEPLRLLLESPDLRRSIGTAGQTTARARYNIKLVADEWERILGMVLS